MVRVNAFDCPGVSGQVRLTVTACVVAARYHDAVERLCGLWIWNALESIRRNDVEGPCQATPAMQEAGTIDPDPEVPESLTRYSRLIAMSRLD